MSNSRRVIILLLGVMLSSHGVTDEPLKLTSVFNADEVKWVKEKGRATVTGTAAIRLENGKLRDCSGFNVELLPVADYSNERILKTYGNNTGGQILMSQKPPKFTPDVKAYHEMVLFSKCNANGMFTFKDVPNGEYYILAFIIWDEKQGELSHKAGGATMKRILVKKDAGVEVNL